MTDIEFLTFLAGFGVGTIFGTIMMAVSMAIHS
jgi:hypothetical protein